MCGGCCTHTVHLHNFFPPSLLLFGISFPSFICLSHLSLSSSVSLSVSLSLCLCPFPCHSVFLSLSFTVSFRLSLSFLFLSLFVIVSVSLSLFLYLPPLSPLLPLVIAFLFLSFSPLAKDLIHELLRTRSNYVATKKELDSMQEHLGDLLAKVMQHSSELFC